MGSGNLGIADAMIAEMVQARKQKAGLAAEVGSFVVGGIVGVLILGGMLVAMSWEKSLPGLTVAGREVGGLTTQETGGVLQKAWESWSLSLVYGEARVEVPKRVLVSEVEETAAEVARVGRGEVIEELVEYLRGRRGIEMGVKLNEEEYEEWIEELAIVVEIPGKRAEVKSGGGGVEVINGDDGVLIARDELRENILIAAGRLESLIELPVKEKVMRLNEEEVERLMGLAEELAGDKLEIVVDEGRASLQGQELVSLLAVEPGLLGAIDEDKIASYIEGLAERFEREPQDAKLAFVEGQVTEFAPARDGIEIEMELSKGVLVGAVESLLEEESEEARVELAVKRTPPKVTTEEVNSLGIVERIGKGESYYAHSIPNRVYNVALAASRVSGALVPPGEEFSFNGEVGEITAGTGYKTAYVIANGRTELGDGGGVCQVSTTVFRAALNAGLPITERWAHAYRVGYYEQNSQPGFDATIYSPSKDLRFVNDTPGHILVQAVVEEADRHLVIEIYGTKDGRVSLVSPARVWGVSPPPPDLYQDDPTLAAGVVKQVDWAAWGAKTSFDYRVERGGETVFSKTFNSTFRPWQNVFLRGVAPQVQ